MQAKALPFVNSDLLVLGDLFWRRIAKPARVYYPGCGTDATPGVVFLESHVVFLDCESFGLECIRKLLPNSELVHARAESYSPQQPFDLVIDMHSHAPFDAEVKDLRSGGHLIIANKMSDNAFDSPLFELVAVFVVNRENEPEDVRHGLILKGLDAYEEQGTGNNPFSNRRKLKARYYVFRKK